MTESEALAAISKSLYNRRITWFDTFDEIDGILRSVGHGPAQEPEER